MANGLTMKAIREAEIAFQWMDIHYKDITARPMFLHQKSVPATTQYNLEFLGAFWGPKEECEPRLRRLLDHILAEFNEPNQDLFRQKFPDHFRILFTTFEMLKKGQQGLFLQYADEISLLFGKYSFRFRFNDPLPLLPKKLTMKNATALLYPHGSGDQTASDELSDSQGLDEISTNSNTNVAFDKLAKRLNRMSL